MQEVKRYPIVIGETHWDIPKDAKLLSVAADKEGASLYALIDPEKDLEERIFTTVVASVDRNVDVSAENYIGCWAQGEDTFHLFEITKEETDVDEILG